jgi:hypothetical protein
VKNNGRQIVDFALRKSIFFYTDLHLETYQAMIIFKNSTVFPCTTFENYHSLVSFHLNNGMKKKD